MSGYIIMITPDTFADGGTGAPPHTTIRVDVSGSHPRIVELKIRSPDEGTLTAHNMPAVDLGLLVRTLLPLNDGAAASPSEDIADSRSSTSISDIPEEGSESGRAYRKMPDATEVLAVFGQVGTVTRLAKHFGVPRHTAQGWMGRIRKVQD